MPLGVLLEWTLTYDEIEEVESALVLDEKTYYDLVVKWGFRFPNVHIRRVVLDEYKALKKDLRTGEE